MPPQVSVYSFEKHKKTSSLQLLDIKSGAITTLFEDLNYSEPTWVSESDFIFVRNNEKGTTSLMLSDVSKTYAE